MALKEKKKSLLCPRLIARGACTALPFDCCTLLANALQRRRGVRAKKQQKEMALDRSQELLTGSELLFKCDSVNMI